MTSILQLLLLPTRGIVRTLLHIPYTAPFMWRNVHKIRDYYAKHLITKTFVTRYDNDIKLNVSISEHIESQIFWQGVQEGDRGEVT
jgi:hypothetical protein